jgi:hypothetical protein
MPWDENDPIAKPRLSAFTQALAELGLGRWPQCAARPSDLAMAQKRNFLAGGDKTLARRRITVRYEENYKWHGSLTFGQEMFAASST